MDTENLDLKTKIFKQLKGLLEEKIIALKDLILTTKEARDADTKSSVGDKYETARSMAQIEIQKSEMQLHKTRLLLSELSKIDLKK